MICLHSCVANSEYILLRPTKLAVKSEICRLENPQSIYRHGFRDYFCLSYVFDLIFCAPSGICVWTHRHAYEIFWPSGHRHRRPLTRPLHIIYSKLESHTTKHEWQYLTRNDGGIANTAVQGNLIWRQYTTKPDYVQLTMGYEPAYGVYENP